MRFYVLATLAFTLACSANEEPASDLNYQLLGYTSGVMPDVRGSQFGICPRGGEHPAFVSAAINAAGVWLRTLAERFDGVTTTVVLACPGNVDVTFSQSVGRAHAYPERHPRIFLGPNDSGRLDEVLLHEFGHAFGLNDTYVEGVWSCKPGQPTSVMCKGDTPYLQPDDVEGVIAAYTAVFGGLGAKSTGSKTGTTTTTTTTTQSGAEVASAARLDCNADYSRIRQGGQGICLNRSSGYCYRYGNNDVLYDLGQVACQ